MVTEKKVNGKTHFMCEECRFYYKNRKIALQCEEFCRKNKSCNLKLIKYAIKTK